MALHGSIEINREMIGWWSAVRKERDDIDGDPPAHLVR